MRIDGHDPDARDWRVFHVEECRQLRHVQWVDDELRQWSQYLYPLVINVATGEVASRTHDARRILIIPESKLILINPVDDPTDAEREREAEEWNKRVAAMRKNLVIAWRDMSRAERARNHNSPFAKHHTLAR